MEEEVCKKGVGLGVQYKNNLQDIDAYKKIYIGKYCFVLLAKEDLILPVYKGSTLRGGFGITFRQICCVNKGVKVCNYCTLKEKCVYAYIFESSPSKESDRLRNLAEIPRPFIIEPPLEEKTIYRKGEILKFNLILIGKANDFLPYFIFTFKRLGEVGLGIKYGKYELSTVYNSLKEKIYDSKHELIKHIDSKFNPLEKVSKSMMSNLSNSNFLSLLFLTPTRIKFSKDLMARPEYHILIRALLHRLSALAYFHCGVELNIDYKSLISDAEKVKIEEEDLRWFDWERYSSRQDTRMKLGGFVGKITYNGDFQEFLPLLILGEYAHIGKNCTFGLGKYEIARKN